MLAFADVLNNSHGAARNRHGVVIPCTEPYPKNLKGIRTLIPSPRFGMRIKILRLKDLLG
jgi:hypothetical protein